jgi:IS5 family transposase
MTPTRSRYLRRSNAIEATISYMKTDGGVALCALKGKLGDAPHAVMCGCGHNICMILARFRALWAETLASYYVLRRVRTKERPHRG